MIPKRQNKTPKRRRAREPVEVDLTVCFKFGEQPEDRVTVLDRQRIPMVNSVFESRDRILRAFAGLLIKTGLQQPAVAADLFPIARLLRRKSRSE